MNTNMCIVEGSKRSSRIEEGIRDCLEDKSDENYTRVMDRLTSDKEGNIGYKAYRLRYSDDNISAENDVIYVVLEDRLNLLLNAYRSYEKYASQTSLEQFLHMDTM